MVVANLTALVFHHLGIMEGFAPSLKKMILINEPSRKVEKMLLCSLGIHPPWLEATLLIWQVTNHLSEVSFLPAD